jgi:hypothetical protein
MTILLVASLMACLTIVVFATMHVSDGTMGVMPKPQFFIASGNIFNGNPHNHPVK